HLLSDKHPTLHKTKEAADYWIASPDGRKWEEQKLAKYNYEPFPFIIRASLIARMLSSALVRKLRRSATCLFEPPLGWRARSRATCRLTTFFNLFDQELSFMNHPGYPLG